MLVRLILIFARLGDIVRWVSTSKMVAMRRSRGDFDHRLMAEAYHTVRAEWPRELATWLLYDSPEPLTVLELGAGTGKLTAALVKVKAGHRVIATDPSENMLQYLRESHPDVETRLAKAEQLDLEPDSVDAVVGGTMGHWLSDEVYNEIIPRVLRVGGTLSMAWARHRPDPNNPDHAWLGEYNKLVRNYVKTAGVRGNPRTRTVLDDDGTMDMGPHFGTVQRTVVQGSEPLGKRGHLIRALRSRSDIRALEENVQGALAGSMFSFLAQHREITGDTEMPGQFIGYRARLTSKPRIGR